MDSSRLLPTSRAMIAASANLRSRIRLAALRSVATRSRHGRCAQSRCAACAAATRSEEHTSELQSQSNLVCRLLLEKKKTNKSNLLMYVQKKYKKMKHI